MLFFPDRPSRSKSRSQLPAAVTVAAYDDAVAQSVQADSQHPNLRVYTSADVIGVQIGGVVKNIIAIAAGISDGLRLGQNARAALITRGLAEMTRLAVRMGADPLTLAGLPGLGDLILTCAGDLSRNRAVGLQIAAGKSLTGNYRLDPHDRRRRAQYSFAAFARERLGSKCLSSSRCTRCCMAGKNRPKRCKI